jgi:hypothetical protein
MVQMLCEIWDSHSTDGAQPPDTMPCSVGEIYRCCRGLYFPALKIKAVLFSKTCKFMPDYAASHPRRWVLFKLVIAHRFFVGCQDLLILQGMNRNFLYKTILDISGTNCLFIS